MRVTNELKSILRDFLLPFKMCLIIYSRTNNITIMAVLVFKKYRSNATTRASVGTLLGLTVCLKLYTFLSVFKGSKLF